MDQIQISSSIGGGGRFFFDRAIAERCISLYAANR